MPLIFLECFKTSEKPSDLFSSCCAVSVAGCVWTVIDVFRCLLDGYYVVFKVWIVYWSEKIYQLYLFSNLFEWWQNLFYFAHKGKYTSSSWFEVVAFIQNSFQKGPPRFTRPKWLKILYTLKKNFIFIHQKELWIVKW